MSEVLHFTYRSIGNFVKLLATICWEKTASPRDISLWHQRFDRDEADDLFEKFAEELFPEGKTLDIPDIELIAEYAGEFLTKDPEAVYNAIVYDKRHIDSWVFFKPEQKLVEVNFGGHSEAVRNIVKDFFRGFDDEISKEYISKFILDNFEIKSDNLTVERIARDNAYLAESINFRNRRV